MAIEIEVRTRVTIGAGSHTARWCTIRARAHVSPEGISVKSKDSAAFQTSGSASLSAMKRTAAIVVGSLVIGSLVTIAVMQWNFDRLQSSAKAVPQTTGNPIHPSFAPKTSFSPSPRVSAREDISGGPPPGWVPPSSGSSSKPQSIASQAIDGNLKYQVTSWDGALPSFGVDGGLVTATWKAAGAFYVFKLNVSNIGKSPVQVSNESHVLVGADNSKNLHDYVAEATYSGFFCTGKMDDAEKCVTGGLLNPGNSMNVVLIFDVSKAFRFKALELHAFDGSPGKQLAP